LALIGPEGLMGMVGVDKIGEIRRAYFEQDRLIKEIVRTLSVSCATVRKATRRAWPWPEHGGKLDRFGMEAAGIRASTGVRSSFPCRSPSGQPIFGNTTASKMPARRSTRNRKIQSAGFRINSRRW